MRDANGANPLLDDSRLRLLACPVCHGDLAYGGGDEIVCQSCRRQYPVRDGLPVLLASAATQP